MTKLISLVVFMAMVAAVPFAMAQDDMPKCVTALDPCGPFINSTSVKPPAACCDPLKAVLGTDLACVCGVFSSVQMIQTLSLNVTEALTLPGRCGLKFDLISECKALLAPSMAPSPVSHGHKQSPKDSPSSSTTPTATPPVAQGPKPSDAPGKITSIGSVIVSFLLLASFMLY